MRLVKDRALHQLAEQLLGEPVAVWRSTFWIKPARARRTEWHQDTFKEEGFGWFPNVNAWIAIDDTDPDNGVRFVAGSQQQLIELTRFKQPSYLAQLQQSVQLPAARWTARNTAAQKAQSTVWPNARRSCEGLRQRRPKSVLSGCCHSL